MLRLNRASKNILNVLNATRNNVRREISVLQNKRRFSIQSYSRALTPSFSSRLMPVTTSNYLQKHLYSTNKKDDEEVEPIENEPEVGAPGEFIHTHLPATVAIPEVWPYLPCVATSRNPVFPRFMKILEVCSALLSLTFY